MEIWRSVDGAEVAVQAATWELHPKITFASLADEFRRNPLKAWRNYGSVVKHNVENALKDPDCVLRAINTARHSPWDHTSESFFPWFRGRPGYRYFIHFDLSVNRDATGVAMTHRERRDNGMVSVVDFMLRIEAQLGRNIDYARLRKDFVYALSSRGFHIQCVSYDSFQSVESRAVLVEKGYEVAEVSVDKTTDPYDTVIELLLATTDEDRKLDYYAYPVYVREMQELKLINGRKYDHPPKSRTGAPGSKDCADSVAGSVFNSIEYEIDNPEAAAPLIIIHRQKPQDAYGDRRSAL